MKCCRGGRLPGETPSQALPSPAGWTGNCACWGLPSAAILAMPVTYPEVWFGSRQRVSVALPHSQHPCRLLPTCTHVLAAIARRQLMALCESNDAGGTCIAPLCAPRAESAHLWHRSFGPLVESLPSLPARSSPQLWRSCCPRQTQRRHPGVTPVRPYAVHAPSSRTLHTQNSRCGIVQATSGRCVKRRVAYEWRHVVHAARSDWPA